MRAVDISSRRACVIILPFLLAAILLPVAMYGQSGKKKGVPSCCAPAAGASTKVAVAAGGVEFPDVTLLDQNGDRRRVRDLVAGKVVVMNFIFTTCTTICPPMGANFVKLKGMLGDRVGKDVVMISVSIDPTTDTPARLKAWSEKFNGGAGWTLLTGEKRDVDNLLKKLKVFSPVKEEHAPIVLIGKEGSGNWIRANGLASPDKLAAIIRGRLADASSEFARDPVRRVVNMESASREENPELKYFTDVKLKNQYGEEMRLYSDLLRGKIVVINPFFSECTGSCPVMNTTMEQLQSYLGDRVGKDVELISITVDPANDTPEKLAAYAERFHAKRGWYFLSGDPANVDLALKKFGQQVDVRENHKTIMLIGNIPTRLWKKVNGLAPPKDIISVLEKVLHDKGQENKGTDK
ncbi:MAG: SCO family protein [Candidatus Kapaibacterium sp.]